MTGSTAHQGVDAWRESELAKWVDAAEAPVFKSQCADLFGYQMLQIGIQPGLVSGLEECSIRNKSLVVADPGPAAAGALLAKPDTLPILSDCIDVVVLPHTLDFSADPRQVLREVERILIPEGRVVISGFNPLSLWGARRVFRRMRNRQPWKAHFISTHRLQDWLSLLGFDVEQVELRLYRPPTQQVALMRSLNGMERLGQRFWPWAGATYIIRAVKRVSTLTPVGPQWVLDKGLGNQVAEPSASAGFGNILPFKEKND